MHLALCRSSCVLGRQQFDAYVQITMLHKLALEVSSHSHDPALAKLTSDINNVRNTLKSFTKSSQTMSIIQSTSLQGTGPRAWIQLFVRNRTGDYAYSVALADDSLKWRQAVAPGGLVYVEMQKIQAFDYRRIKLK